MILKNLVAWPKGFWNKWDWESFLIQIYSSLNVCTQDKQEILRIILQIFEFFSRLIII